MTRSRIIIISLTVGLAAFFIGRWTAAPPVVAEARKVLVPTAPRSAPPGSSSAAAAKSIPAAGRLRELDQRKAEQAASLSSAERLALISKGSLIFNPETQADMLCGVIAVLNKEEVAEATKILGAVQDRGNHPSQRVWDAIWKQWGKTDPLTCLADFKEKPDGKSREDARHLMEGWLETDPAAAQTWAREPKSAFHDAEAAACAIAQGAQGDPQKFLAALESFPAGDPTAKACLQDYFDLASTTPGMEQASAVYDQLPESLKATAWPTTLGRLCYSDPQGALDWMTAHADDPGRDYQPAYRLINDLAEKNPEEMVQWAVQLPRSDESSAHVPHPAILALGQWLRKDPEAAKIWMRAQPADDPFVQAFSNRLSSEASRR